MTITFDNNDTLLNHILNHAYTDETGSTLTLTGWIIMCDNTRHNEYPCSKLCSRAEQAITFCRKVMLTTSCHLFSCLSSFGHCSSSASCRSAGRETSGEEPERVAARVREATREPETHTERASERQNT